MIEALQKGDEVITAGGMLGRITKLSDALRRPSRSRRTPRSTVQTAPRCRSLLPKGTIKTIQ